MLQQDTSTEMKKDRNSSGCVCVHIYLRRKEFE